jgi:hypothetical protein
MPPEAVSPLDLKHHLMTTCSMTRQLTCGPAINDDTQLEPSFQSSLATIRITNINWLQLLYVPNHYSMIASVPDLCYLTLHNVRAGKMKGV